MTKEYDIVCMGGSNSGFELSLKEIEFEKFVNDKNLSIFNLYGKKITFYDGILIRMKE